MSKSNWPKRYFEKLKEQEGKSFDRQQANALQRQQVIAKAPVIWDEFASEIIEAVQDFETMRPGHLTHKDERQAATPKVKASTPYRHLELTYRKDGPQIDYKVWEPQASGPPAVELARGEFIFQVKEEDKEVWLFGTSGYAGLKGLLAVSEAVDALLEKLASTS
jgi:hypothetical protein